MHILARDSTPLDTPSSIFSAAYIYLCTRTESAASAKRAGVPCRATRDEARRDCTDTLAWAIESRLLIIGALISLNTLGCCNSILHEKYILLAVLINYNSI